MPTIKKRPPRIIRKPPAGFVTVSSSIPPETHAAVQEFIAQYNAANPAKMSMNSLIPTALIAYVETKKEQ